MEKKLNKSPTLAVAMMAGLSATAPVMADEDKLHDGWSMLSQGTKLLLEGLSEQAQPAIADLATRLGDMSAYETPVILPNGDILIRRKVPTNAAATPDSGASESDTGAKTDL